MNAVIIVFLTVSSLFSLSSLAFIITDIILEIRKGKSLAEPIEDAPAEEAATRKASPVLPTEESLPTPVSITDAASADALISDKLALSSAIYEKGAGKGRLGIINIGDIDKAFEPQSEVTLDSLKKKGLMLKNVGRLKVLADGTLSKPLTVKAESYSVEAVKMIELTGGSVIILKD